MGSDPGSVQADETHNCALIGRLLEKKSTPYSHAGGEFYVPMLNPEARDVFTKMGGL
jgi:hypothetical protein